MPLRTGSSTQNTCSVVQAKDRGGLGSASGVMLPMDGVSAGNSAEWDRLGAWMLALGEVIPWQQLPPITQQPARHAEPCLSSVWDAAKKKSGDSLDCASGLKCCGDPSTSTATRTSFMCPV